jgi:hypothetical protein
VYKPKRGIETWWNQRSAEFKFALAVGIFAGVGVFMILSAIRLSNDFRATAPCESFGGYSAGDIPVRCYAYYGLKEPQR